MWMAFQSRGDSHISLGSFVNKITVIWVSMGKQFSSRGRQETFEANSVLFSAISVVWKEHQSRQIQPNSLLAEGTDWAGPLVQRSNWRADATQRIGNRDLVTLSGLCDPDFYFLPHRLPLIQAPSNTRLYSTDPCRALWSAIVPGWKRSTIRHFTLRLAVPRGFFSLSRVSSISARSSRDARIMTSSQVLIRQIVDWFYGRKTGGWGN